MKYRRKVESKVPTTKTNTNRKKASEAGESDKQMGPSLFKKNEFALILFGALLLTLIVFFLFFRGPGDNTDEKTLKTGSSGKMVSQSESFTDLEKRINMLEQTLSGKNFKKPGSVDPIQERVARLETAFSVKFDSLIERMGSIEKRLAALNRKKVTTPAKSKSSPVVKTSLKTKTSLVKTPAKQPIVKQTKAAMFHTVKKGETLYSIGKKYQISVPTLQKLNKLSPGAKLYIGMNLLIR
jgi:LysM repeat protein